MKYTHVEDNNEQACYSQMICITVVTVVMPFLWHFGTLPLLRSTFGLPVKARKNHVTNIYYKQFTGTFFATISLQTNTKLFENNFGLFPWGIHEMVQSQTSC